MRLFERWRNTLLYDVICLAVSAMALWFVGVETTFFSHLGEWISDAKYSNAFMLIFMMSFVFMIAVGFKSIRLQREIKARARAEEQAKDLARRDSLTGLANRRLLIEAMENAAANLNSDSRYAVFLVDLDRFKPVNDIHGHAAGDAVLCETARRLERVAGMGAVVARLGGDEFAVFVGFDRHDNVMTIAKGISSLLGEPLHWAGSQLEVGATVGIAVMPEDASDPENLLHCADLAMYCGKSSGRGSSRRYLKDMDEEMKARALVRSELKCAIEIDEILPFYQPIVHLADGRTVGFEALARWQHPRDGILPPSQFIHAAEEAGLLSDLSYGLMRRVFREMKHVPGSHFVAINISPLQLRDRWMPEKVLAALTETGFSPARLELEITETALMEDIETAQAVLKSLRNIGVSIALDDFGTGYSSLSYLRELCIDKLKIDKSFVHAMASNDDSAKIVHAILGLGRSLGLQTTAEGIEAEQEAISLAEIGCVLGQGFHFGRPMRLDEATAHVVQDHAAAESVRAAKVLRIA